MNRRRMMMLQQNKGFDWDFDWSYKEGLLSNHLATRFSGVGAKEELTENGLLLEVSTEVFANTNYVRYEFAPLNSNKAILELLINVNNFSAWNGEGFRISLSQGSKGCHLYIQDGYIGYAADTKADGEVNFVKKFPASLNTDYLIRIEYDIAVGNKVTVNDTLMYEGNNFSTAYCTANRLYQQKSGSSYLKEVRFKHIA